MTYILDYSNEVRYANRRIGHQSTTASETINRSDQQPQTVALILQNQPITQPKVRSNQSQCHAIALIFVTMLTQYSLSALNCTQQPNASTPQQVNRNQER